MRIIGAGMAGLIAANYFRKDEPVVYEAQHSLPHNHDALLRFRSDRIGQAVGIPFKKVEVRKNVIHGSMLVDNMNVYLANTYSFKTTGRILSRSIWDLKPSQRYIAPPNFIEKLATGVNILYGVNIGKKAIKEGEPTISTIPMPVLMDIMEWKHKPEFSYRPVWAITADLLTPITDVYQTIYYPELSNPAYRASIIGSHIIIECTDEYNPDDTQMIDDKVMSVLSDFGIPSSAVHLADDPVCRKQEYGKIVPIDDDIRKEFMYTMTRDHNLYSLGRFGTWRQLLLDDLVQDLDVISGLISVEGRRRDYTRSLALK